MRHTGLHLALLWAPVIACAALIWFLSSRPSVPAAEIIELAYADKIAHGCAYALLAALLFRSLRFTFAMEVSLWLVAAAVAIATVYGIVNEINQLFIPGRTADPWDVFADVVGAAMAASALYVLSASASNGRRNGRSSGSTEGKA